MKDYNTNWAFHFDVYIFIFWEIRMDEMGLFTFIIMNQTYWLIESCVFDVLFRMKSERCIWLLIITLLFLVSKFFLDCFYSTLFSHFILISFCFGFFMIIKLPSISDFSNFILKLLQKWVLLNFSNYKLKYIAMLLSQSSFLFFCSEIYRMTYHFDRGKTVLIICILL